MSEVYSQDDEVVTIDHAGRDDWRLSCTCGLAARASSESEATNLAMSHVLQHDIAAEERYEGESEDVGPNG